MAAGVADTMFVRVCGVVDSCSLVDSCVCVGDLRLPDDFDSAVLYAWSREASEAVVWLTCEVALAASVALDVGVAVSLELSPSRHVCPL